MLFFLVSPFFADTGLKWILDILFVLIILSCVNAVSNVKPALLATVILAALGFAALFAAHGKVLSGSEREALICHCAAFILCIAVTAVIIIQFAVRAGRVTMDKIAAALCVYILIGISWGLAYILLEFVQPGSFSFSGSPLATPLEEGNALNRVDSILDARPSFSYFSFVTMTTLGYGDITPLTQPARSLAVLQAIVGQFFLAVLIARLVGLHIVHSTTKIKNL